MSEAPNSLAEVQASWQDPVARAFRTWGYLQANIDSLDRIPSLVHPDIEDVSASADASAVDRWRDIYAGTTGAEFMHIIDRERSQWVAAVLESPAPATDSPAIFRRIAQAELFERFLHSRYVGTKRYSLEGVTGLIPLLDALLSGGSDLGAEFAFLAMSHRGRLNVMANVVGIPGEDMFAGMEDVDPRSVLGSGDVKYHLGATGVWHDPSGERTMKVHLVSNPSHLEAVVAVAMGRTRARQWRLGEGGRQKVLPITMHGDAAFAGQGITAETLNLETLPGYTVGGSIRIIVNNRVGFTTRPQSLHSSGYSSDLAKRLSIPILHVNAEDPDAIVRAAQLAVEYRYRFGSDVLIDLVGFRRYGHSEIEDPTITQPLLYERIQSWPMLHQSYAKKVGISDDEVAKTEKEIKDELAAQQEAGRQRESIPSLRKLPEYWDRYAGGIEPPPADAHIDTAVPAERLQEIAAAMASVPDGFSIHPKVKKILDARAEMARGKRPTDWGAAELFAMGSLSADGYSVRFSGQDVRRGTFNQRHAALRDIHTDQDYVPLSHTNWASFAVYDSPLSEAAILGFEYGASRDAPDALVCWESQFGDFANGAQVITDQFIAAGEDKWRLLSGLVMLLPHGYEGQGPEHSSARVERFLMLSAEHNMFVTQPSTAAQYFHLLRHHTLQTWRKPLIVFTPKGMLRAPAAASLLGEFTEGRFHPVLGDPTIENARKVLLCSGRVAHDLFAAREKRGRPDVAIVRIERLYPFPEEELKEQLARHSSCHQIVWVQEEPANMGALHYVRPILSRLVGDRHISTIKRTESASPATGSPKAHRLEQEALVELALS